MFAEAADAAGVPNARPYDLRHSFVSLLIAQGATVVDVASQAGHAPTMTLDTYAHLFNDLAQRRAHLRRGTDPRLARATHVPGCVRLVSARGDPITANQ
jgi:integrase